MSVTKRFVRVIVLWCERAFDNAKIDILHPFRQSAHLVFVAVRKITCVDNSLVIVPNSESRVSAWMAQLQTFDRCIT